MQAFCGYVYGSFPPGRVARFTEDGQYLMHIFQAHAATYDALKAMPGGCTANVPAAQGTCAFRRTGPHSI